MNERADAVWVKLPLSSESVQTVRKRVDALADLLDAGRKVLDLAGSTESAAVDFVTNCLRVVRELDRDVQRLKGRSRRRKTRTAKKTRRR